MESLEETEARIAEVRKRYTRLAITCKAAGLKVNPQTVQEYLKEIKALQAKLN